MLIPVYNSLLQVSHNLSNGFSKEQPIQIQSLLLGNFFTFSLGRHYYYLRKCLVIHYQSLCPKCEGTEVSKMVIHVWAARYAHVGTINLWLARVHYSLSLSPSISSYPCIVNNVKHELIARCDRGYNAYLSTLPPDIRIHIHWVFEASLCHVPRKPNAWQCCMVTLEPKMYMATLSDKKKFHALKKNLDQPIKNGHSQRNSVTW